MGGRSRRVGPGSPQVNPEETERHLSTDFSPPYPLSPVRKDTPSKVFEKTNPLYASTKLQETAVRQYSKKFPQNPCQTARFAVYYTQRKNKSRKRSIIMLYTIENAKIKVTVTDMGAEMTSLILKKTGPSAQVRL